MKRALLAILILAFPYLVSHPIHAGQFKVVRVADGDTIKIMNDGKTSTIRLGGIDAPETSNKKHQPDQPFSERAKLHLTKLVLDKIVEIDGYGLDRYSRI